MSFCVVHLPQFALQAALRHEPEAWLRPVALLDASGTTPRVIDATPPARAAGVTDGLTAPQALARCRDVAFRSRSPAPENAATAAVLQCAYAFSPNLEATHPGTVTLDLRGLALPGSAGARAAAEGQGDAAPTPCWRVWATRLAAELAALDLRPSLGFGPTPSVARHAARWPGWPASVPTDSAMDAPMEARTDARTASSTAPIRWVTDPAAFVAGLPVAALEPSSDVEDLFRRWGLRTVGEVLALGQGELAERLGLEALALFAAASVSSLRPLRHVQPPEHFAESHEFDPPVETLEPLLFLLRRFVDGLARRLEPCGLAAGELRVHLRLESGVTLERRLRLPQPTRQPDILFRTLHTHLENIRTDTPVQAVALTVQPARPEQKQFSLFEAALRDPHQFQETLARLSALVGADRVGSPVRESSHRPDAFRLVPPDFENAPVPAPEDPPSLRPRPPLLRPTPLRRLRPPAPAEVESDAGSHTPGRPLHLHASVLHGRLTVAVGPWRTSGHWWEPGSWQREEWDVVGPRPDTVVRLVREAGAWRVEALLD